MKKISSIILVLGLVFTSANIFGQTTNYTTQQNPLPCLDKEFSVVLHVVKDSSGATNVIDAQVDAAFESLNEAFAPICASFKICERREIENFQYDVIDSIQEWDEMLIKEHQPNRINVFLMSFNSLDDASPIEEGGYATLNGIQELETGGIALHKAQVPLPSYLIHLFGHYFGLLHTFEGNGAENVDGSNCDTAGDLLCDTPADNYMPPGPNPVDGGYIDPSIECRYIHTQPDANGELYRPDVGNYMSYYEPCRCGFSHQQFELMAKNFLSSSPKMW